MRREKMGMTEQIPAEQIPEICAGLLKKAEEEFEASLCEPLTEAGALIGLTAAAMWAEWRLLIWTCDHCQERVQVLATVASIENLPPVSRLCRVYQLKPSVALVDLLASLIVQAMWGLSYLRQVAAGDPRVAAKLTGLLTPKDNKELLRDLKIDSIADWKNSEDAEDLRQVGVEAAVRRESELRKQHRTELGQWIRERGLSLSYPAIDGQSTKLSDRWDERILLTKLVDRMARLALPHSSKAGHLRHAAHWAVSDELKRRDTDKRGGAVTQTPLDVSTEVAADPWLTEPERLVARSEIIATARKSLGDNAARYFEGIADGLTQKEAAEAADVSEGMARRYQRQMATLLDQRPRPKQAR